MLTTVAGPPALAARLLAEVDGELVREAVEVDSADALVATWAGFVARSRRVRRHLAATLGEDSLARRRTAFDWRRAVATATGHDSDLPAQLAQLVARGDGARLARLLAPADRIDPAALRWLSRLVGARALPALRAVVRTPPAVSAAAAAMLDFLDVPALATELVAPWHAVAKWLAGAPSRARALARDGLIRLPSSGLGRVSEARGPYRSLPERMLHEMLEGHPDSGGLFKPNARVAVRFGRSGAEVDLLCADLAIAVEVDGWHHFRAADGYRRDRRKDVALQQHGYLVYRVLAEDITDNPAAVAAQIREVVRSRLRSGRHHGSSA